jgi:hypothetical protein
MRYATTMTSTLFLLRGWAHVPVPVPVRLFVFVLSFTLTTPIPLLSKKYILELSVLASFPNGRANELCISLVN